MRFITLISILFSATIASADIVFAPSAAYTKIEDETAGAKSKTEISSYDLKLGYVHASGLYLGGMYSMTKVNDDKGSSVGPTIGFSHYSGFYALFTYFLMASHDAGAGSEYTDGMGPQIDIGWVFPITHTFHIGPQVTYRSISYDKFKSGGASVSTDYSRSYMMPAVSLWFNF